MEVAPWLRAAWRDRLFIIRALSPDIPRKAGPRGLGCRRSMNEYTHAVVGGYRVARPAFTGSTRLCSPLPQRGGAGHIGEWVVGPDRITHFRTVTRRAAGSSRVG